MYGHFSAVHAMHRRFFGFLTHYCYSFCFTYSVVKQCRQEIHCFFVERSGGNKHRFGIHVSLADTLCKMKMSGGTTLPLQAQRIFSGQHTTPLPSTLSNLAFGTLIARCESSTTARTPVTKQTCTARRCRTQSDSNSFKFNLPQSDVFTRNWSR